MMASFAETENKIHQAFNFILFEVLFFLAGTAHLKTMYEI
jgi:hypothetical protein